MLSSSPSQCRSKLTFSYQQIGYILERFGVKLITKAGNEKLGFCHKNLKSGMTITVVPEDCRLEGFIRIAHPAIFDERFVDEFGGQFHLAGFFQRR